MIFDKELGRNIEINSLCTYKNITNSQEIAQYVIFKAL
jgi:hypothetical protein